MKPLLYLVALFSVVSSVAADPSAISGHVRQADGQPVAGAQVALFAVSDLASGAVAQATTDDAGYFAFSLKALGGSPRPAGFVLGPNYPNPFNPSTIIPYQLPVATPVRLEVFNVLGQHVKTLVDGERPAGAHTALWDATDAMGQAVGAGVYFYRLSGGGAQWTRKMVLIDGQAGVATGGAGWTAAARPGGDETDAPVYGLTVLGEGLVPYVDPAFRVEGGMGPVEVVLTAPARAKRLQEDAPLLGDVDLNGSVDIIDALIVAAVVTVHTIDPSRIDWEDLSFTLGVGDLDGDGVVDRALVASLLLVGDVNGDDYLNMTDAYLIGVYSVNPSDPGLPAGIGEPVSRSGGGGSDDHSNTRSGATSLSVGSSRSGRLETGGDVDYFSVQVSRSGTLTVYTTGSTDTRGALQNSSGSNLATDDDGGSGNNFRIERSVNSGTYYIQVRGYSSSTTGSYTVHARFQSGGGGGGGSSSPDLVVESPSVSDNTLTTGQSFTLRATVRNRGTARSSSTTLRYYRSSNSTISTSDRSVGTDAVSGLAASGTSAESISLNAPSSAGTYYYGACVNTVSGESNTDNNCSAGVRVTVGGGGGSSSDDHSNTRSSATSLSVGSSRSGRLETGGDVDYFRVQVSRSGTLTVYTTGGTDTYGTLQNSSGSSLATNDDGGSGRNFSIARSVSAGTYYIQVRGYSSSTTGSYTVHARFQSGGGGSSSAGGACSVGQELSPGQSCTVDIPNVNVGSNRFEVRTDGSGCYGNICAGTGLNLNGFQANKIAGTSRWRINALP